jgi:hypothetical protein
MKRAEKFVRFLVLAKAVKKKMTRETIPKEKRSG